MKKEELNKILEIKRKLQSANLDDLLENLVYMPEIPIVGYGKMYVIEEHFGIKVAIIVGDEEDN